MKFKKSKNQELADSSIQLKALMTQLHSIKMGEADQAMLDHQVNTIMDMLPDGIDSNKVAEITKKAHDYMVFSYKLGNLRCFQGFVKPDELKL